MLSTLLITRDSGPWLRYVLANVRPWTDELVVVVDEESSDDTYAVAQATADTVVRWPIGGYMEAVLQRAVTELCHGGWIMRLDDDELMPPDFADILPWLMDPARQADDYAFRRLLLVEDGYQMAESPDLWPDYQVRLRTADAYRQTPWPTVAHTRPAPLRRWQVATDSTTIWHLNLMVRSPEETKRRLARIWQLDAANMARVDRWYRHTMSPWAVRKPDGPPPAELPALLAAIGNPQRPVTLYERTPETHMRAGREGVFVIGLEQFADTLPADTVMAEIGVFAGEGTRIFLNSGKVAKVYGVDPWRFTIDDPSLGLGLFTGADVEAAFDRLVLERTGQVVKVKDASPGAARHFADGELDLVYIDADHAYEACKADIAAWWPKVRPGGILAGHDYGQDWPGVQKAVDERFGQPEQVFLDTTWMVHKETS